ncbi:MAG: hypothetical protein ACR2RB_01035 [Gammaproteobacteria bacterium]
MRWTQVIVLALIFVASAPNSVRSANRWLIIQSQIPNVSASNPCEVAAYVIEGYGLERDGTSCTFRYGTAYVHFRGGIVSISVRHDLAPRLLEAIDQVLSWVTFQTYQNGETSSIWVVVPEPMTLVQACEVARRVVGGLKGSCGNDSISVAMRGTEGIILVSFLQTPNLDPAYWHLSRIIQLIELNTN